jgi:hypothetical protein
MTFFGEIASHKYRTWKTICMSLVFVSLGLVNSSVGPTMLDLQLMVRTTLEQITLIIPMKSAGNMFGAVICTYSAKRRKPVNPSNLRLFVLQTNPGGLILPYTDHQVVLPLSVLFMTVFFVYSAFCTTFVQLLSIVTVIGIFCGFIVNGSYFLSSFSSLIRQKVSK